MKSIQATPSAVLGYCNAGHTSAEAAATFGLHERTIRKWKARALTVPLRSNIDQLTPTRAKDVSQSQELAESDNGATAPSETENSRTFHINDDAIARDGQWWKCPRCMELMPPLPGTTGAVWNAHGCYLHQVAPLWEIAANTITEEIPIDPAPASEPAIAPDPLLQKAVLNLERPAPASLLVMVEPARSVDYWGISAAIWLISWGKDHPAEVKLLIGVVIVWVLVSVAF